MNGWGIHRIHDMIAPVGVQASRDGKNWYRAVPVPYTTIGWQRLSATWAVLVGKAHAVVWPEIGDLERALNQGVPRSDAGLDIIHQHTEINHGETR